MDAIFDSINNLVKIIGDAIAGLVGSLLPHPISDIVVMALGTLAIFIVVLTLCAGLTYLERKLVARIQDRIGPNMAGPKGLLLPIADAIKLFTKELTTPAAADKWVYNLAPIIVMVFAVLTYAVVPFAPDVIGTNLNIGVFYIIAIGSASTIAILMAGWGSRNKFSLLGAFRTVAQLIGYEVPMLLNLIPIIMLTGSMSLVDIVERQWNTGVPFLIYFPLSALCFLISGLAETGRSPVDLLEAESEIVAGFHVEYSGMKFGLIMIGEYANSLAIAVVFVSLFLGGYRGPILPPYLWLLIKTLLVFFGFMWLRGTLPRVRIDQLLNMNWKFLVPISVVHILLIMFEGKLFVTDPARIAATGGILVPVLLQAVIMGGTSIGLLLGGLLLAGRSVRGERLQHDADMTARRTANQKAAMALVK